MRRNQVLVIVALYLVSLWMAFAAARIEWLNARADYVLPNAAAKAESKKHGGSGAWRATRMDEHRWRRVHLHEQPGDPNPRPLTDEEQLRMRRDIDRANANYRLRDFVGVAGCIQYPLVLFVALIGLDGAISERRRRSIMAVYLVPVVIAVICGGLAFYRGYFTSGLD